MKNTLDAAPSKKKTLNDQLASKEKVMADIVIQKNKTVMSVEKLEVNF